MARDERKHLIKEVNFDVEIPPDHGLAGLSPFRRLPFRRLPIHRLINLLATPAVRPRLIAAQMKDRTSTEATPLQTVYNDTMVAMARDPAQSAAVVVVPTLNSLDSSLYRHRRKRLPPMPATIYDVSL